MTDSRVTYQPIGRLGNQMFQLAACIGYAKKYGVGWSAPSDTKECPRFHEFFPGLPVYDGHEFKRYNVADPSQFNYWPIPFNPNGLKLVGFFQSEKYFEGAHDEIRKIFKLDYYPQFKDHISIHVRRGDYVQHSDSFPPVDFIYLNEALRHVPGDKRLLVFSDDLRWCKNRMTNERFDFYEEPDEFKSLSAMSSCSHHIIANSTFSWWGAWLGHNPDRTIVSPHFETWFGPGNGVKTPPKDLIPNGWIQIRTR